VIIRTYACDDCGENFEVECESGDTGDPDCPNCTKVLQWIPARFNIGTHKGKAIDVTQKIIEEDFGLTNLNDNNREGDVAYRPTPVMQTDERDEIERQVREYAAQTTAPVPIPAANQPQQAQANQVHMNFWGGSEGNAVAARPMSAPDARLSVNL